MKAPMIEENQSEAEDRTTGAAKEARASALRRMSVVMVGTSDAANAGAMCRAMQNFGMDELVLVAPRAENIKGARAQALACAADEILAGAPIYPTLEEATTEARIDYLAGFSARMSHARGPFVTPEEFAAEAWPLLVEGRRVGLVLGREDNGLSNEEIEKCRWKVNIPTTEHSSLNVAQAGVVGLYALRRLAVEAHTVRLPIRGSLPTLIKAATSPARPADFERMMELFEILSERIRFAWKSNPAKALRPFRQILHRAEITQREAGVLMSFVRRCLYSLGDKSQTRRARRARAALLAERDGKDDQPAGD